MGGNNPSHRQALIALGLALSAIIIVIFFGFASDYVAEHYAAKDRSQNYQGSNEDIRAVLSAMREFDPLDDTLAQWIMALFAAVATGASIVAIFLLRDTLKATVGAVDAANRANKILRAEQRPWLTLKRKIECDFIATENDSSSQVGKLFKFRTYLRWRHKIDNVGKSPAFGVKLKSKIIASESIWQAQDVFRQFVSTLNHSLETQSDYTIFPDEDADFGFSETWTAIEYTAVGDATFYLIVAIAYRSQESDIIGVEARLLQITFDHEFLGPWRPKLLEHTNCRVTH